MASTTPSSKLATKERRKSRVITLRLSPDYLAQFPSDASSKPSATPSKVEPSPSVQPPEPNDKSSQSNDTPAPPAADAVDGNSLAPPKVDRRRRGGSAVTGRKRAPPSIDPNGPMRERGRPGPKKKPRLPDGTIDRSQDGPAATTTSNKKGPATTGANPIPAHKLGPKANTGNINANLRALDRSGKPCRKWERKPLNIKSFTGTVWGMSTWKGHAPDSGFAGDVKSDTTGSSDLKQGESSAVASERSNSGIDAGDASMMNGIESSPAPQIAA